MGNYRDPATVTLDFLTLVKLWHTVDGLYIWEFVITLDYEWSVFRGYRQYLWTIWVYSLTRLAALMAVIIHMIGFDTLSLINCQAWITSEIFFAYSAFAGATLLIVIRTIAIWNRNRIIFMITMGIWCTNVGFLIYSIVLLRSDRSSWAPAEGLCVELNTDSSKYNVSATLATDMTLLLIMLAGLLRIHLQGGGMFGLGHLLWKQVGWWWFSLVGCSQLTNVTSLKGIIWILLAAAAEVPAAVRL